MCSCCYKKEKDDAALMRDDLEKLRGAIRRTIEHDRVLLSDALAACRRDPVKYQRVVIDHLERVIDAQTTFIEKQKAV